jgi:hypothetical protein
MVMTHESQIRGNRRWAEFVGLVRYEGSIHRSAARRSFKYVHRERAQSKSDQDQAMMNEGCADLVPFQPLRNGDR